LSAASGFPAHEGVIDRLVTLGAPLPHLPCPALRRSAKILSEWADSPTLPARLTLLVLCNLLENLRHLASRERPQGLPANITGLDCIEEEGGRCTLA